MKKKKFSPQLYKDELKIHKHIVNINIRSLLNKWRNEVKNKEDFACMKLTSNLEI